MYYKLITFVLALFIWFGPGAVVGFGQVHSKVVDGQTGQSVADVQVYWKSQLQYHKGTITNSNGQFMLKLSPHETDILVLKAIGYKTKKLTVHRDSSHLPHPIKLRSRTYQIKKELLVLGHKHRYKKKKPFGNRWGAAQRLNMMNASTSLIRRGAHGAELLMRGLSSDRTVTRVNGVPMFSACVDQMDPVTSYLNPNAIQGLERSGNELGVPGTINIRLDKPEYSQGWTGSLLAGYQTSIKRPKINVAIGYASRHWAWKTTLYWMQAGDLVAGGGKVIENSQQHKFNGTTTVRYHQNRHEVNLRLAYNHSWDVGYPALLMDANKAISYLGSLEYNYHPDWEGVSTISTKIYANKVKHSMDDYSRDVAHRDVMRNMHMPMDGSTKTFGIRQQWAGSFAQQAWTATAEWYRMNAFGDMRMESILTSVPDMYLINLGDIRTNYAGLDLNWDYQLQRDDRLTVDLGIQYKGRLVRRESSARYFETIFGEGTDSRQDIGWNAKVKFTHWFESDMKLALSVSTRYRIPSHKELYGYYIYNYEDGFFYYGNPTLDIEKHYTFDLLFSIDKKRFSVKLIPYIDYVKNWISGIFAEGFDSQNNDYQFKKYKNTGDALLTGADLHISWQPNKHWQLSNHVQYTYGQHLDWNEPLRRIPPLNGTLNLAYYRLQWSLSASWKWAAAQNRIAVDHSIENSTPAYQVINLAGQIRLSPSVDLTLSLNNLLDNYYWTHTSIGDIPSPGRTVEVALGWKF